jgi:hypothetical protein
MTKNFIFIIIFLLLLSLSFSCGCNTKSSPNTGTIDVTSSPRGAEVYLDNQYKGTTPVLITDVSLGEHVIELRLRGYEIWTITGIMNEGGSAQVQASLTPISSPTQVTSTPTTVVAETHEKLNVISYSSYISSIGTLHIVGEVKNSGTINMEYVEIIGTFYDSSKTVVGTDFTFTSIDVLKPNQKSPFDMTETSNVEDIVSVKLDETYRPTTGEPYSGLQILSHSSYISRIGTYHVVGEVKNTGNRDVNYVEVIGTFYDSSGKVVDASFTYTDPSDVSAGQTSPFDLIVMSPQVSKIKTYELQVQGRLV